MEQTRNRLSSLLSKEKSMRADIDHEEYAKGRAESKTASMPELEATPITTPETIDKTRRRITRLLQTKPLMVSQHVDEPTRPKVIRRNNPLFRDDSDAQELLARENAHTPHKNTRKLLIPHPERTLFAPEDVNPKKSIHQVYNQRRSYNENQDSNHVSAYMPSTTKKKKLLARQQRYRDEYRDYAEEVLHYESEESVFELDLKIIREIDNKILHRISRINNAKDTVNIVGEVHSCLEDIRVMGLNTLQLWIKDTASQTLWTMLPEGRKLHIPYDGKSREFQFSDDFVLTGNHSVCSQVYTIRNDDSINDNDDEETNRLVNNRYNHNFELLADFMSKSRSETFDTIDTKDWTAIHAIVLPALHNSSAGDVIGGYLLTSEIMAPSLPFTSTGGHRGQNLLQLRRMTSCQWLQRIAAAATSRLEVLRVIEEHREIAMKIFRLEEAVASKDALTACETLLLDENFNKPNFIASAVAKCGSFYDKYSIKMSWLLVQESEDCETLFGASIPTSERQRSVYVFCDGHNHRIDFTSDIMSIGKRTALVENLLSNRAGVVNTITTSELKNCSMMPSTDDTPTGLQMSLLFVPISFKNNLGITASIVIALSPESSQDVIHSHAQSLSRMFAVSIDRIQSLNAQQEVEKLTQVSSLLWNGINENEHQNADALNSLASIISVVQSETVASLLGVHGSTLLVSHQYASEFVNSAVAPDSTHSTFLKLDGPLKGMAAGAVDSFSWYHELLSGKVVFYNPTEEKSQTNVTTNALKVSKSTHVGESGNALRSGAVMNSSALALQQLVSGVDSATTSAMLIPLNSEAGLCVLVLTDRLHWNSSSERSSISFSVPYVNNLLASSVCSNLIHTLNVVHHARSLSNRLTNEIATKEQLQQEVAESKYFICATKWHRFVKSVLDRTLDHENVTRAGAILELVNHRHSLNASAEEEVSYLQCIEKQLSHLFPSDIIMTSLTKFPVVSLNTSEDASPALLLHGVVVDHYQALPFGVAAKKRSETVESVVGYVRVCRSSKSKHPFTQKEQAKLRKFCEMASNIYTALHRGLRRDYIDGDAKGLLGPMLSQLLPSLLAYGSKKLVELQKFLPLIVSWLKRVCKAEMVILHLNSQNNESVVSSEDIDGKTVHSLEKALLDLNSGVRVMSDVVDDNDDVASSNQMMVKLLNKKDEDSEFLGEVKIFGAKEKNISPEQHSAVSLLSFVLSHVLNAQRTTVEHGTMVSDSVNVIQQLESLVNQEKLSTEHFRHRLNQSFGVMMFMSKLTSAATPLLLSAAINDYLPQVLGVSSAVLLMASSGVSDIKSIAEANDFVVILPNQAAKGEVISRSQLAQLPNYFSDVNAVQSKIELSISSTVVFGAILIFQTADKRRNDLNLEGFDELLTTFFSSTILQICGRCEAVEHNSHLTNKLSVAHNSLRDKEQIQSDLQASLEISASLDNQKSKLQSELATLKHRLEDQLAEKSESLRRLEEEVVHIKSKKDSMSERLNDRIRNLENELLIERNGYQTTLHTKNHLLEILSSFSFDQRCQQETITQWLTDVAESKDVSLVTMSQSESGVLSGGTGIRGILAAAGECIRTGSTVELITAYQATEEPANPHEERNKFRLGSHSGGMKFDSKHFGSSSSLRLASGSESPRSPGSVAPSENISILCVPNRCSIPQNAEEYACFIFVRPITAGQDGKFTDDDKDVINCAVNLTCRTLAKVVVKYSAADFKAAQFALEKKIILVNALRRSVNLSAQIRAREFHTRSDVGRTVVDGVCDLLKRSDNDQCIVEAEMIFPPWNTTAAVLGGDGEIMNRVIASCHSVIKGSLMWCPIVDHNEAVAIIKCERKFNCSSTSTDLLSSSDILMTEVDEEIVNVFGDLSVPLLNRVDLLNETLIGVKQAGQAIMTLQKVNSSIEDRCAVEVGNRLKLEESLKAGADMLGIASAHRVATGQLLDAARKAVLSVTSSLECFIVLPSAASHSYTKDVEFSSVDILERESNAYFTMVSDRPQAIMVRFEAGDMEVTAMQSLRSVSTNVEGSDVTSRPWQSWSVRRLQGELNYRNLVESTGNEELFAMSVPIVLQGGDKAVMTSIRRSVGFCSADRESMSWIGRVLAYCLELRGGDELRHVTKELEAEVKRLKHVDVVNAALDKDFAVIERDLHDIPIVKRKLVEQEYEVLDANELEREGISIIVDCAQSAFGTSSVVQSWSAEEAVQNFGVILPTESFNADGKTISKDGMITENGKITFWIDVNGNPCEGLDFFKSRSKHHSSSPIEEKRKFVTSEGATKNEDICDTVLYVVVQMKGFPVCWVKISTTNNVVRNCRLRLSLMLKLIETHHIWRSKYLGCVSGIAEKQAIVDQQAVTHKELEEALKSNFESVSSLERKEFKLAERIICESIFTSNRIRREVSKAKQPILGMKTWTQPILVNACKAMEASSGCSVSIGLSQSDGKSSEESAVMWLSVEGERKANVPSVDDPISQSVTTGKIVLCLSKHEDNVKTREQLSKVVDELESFHLHAKFEILFVSASEQFPSGTIVTPIPVSAFNGTLVSVTKPWESVLTNKNIATCDQVLAAWIISWVSLRSSIQSAVSDYVKLNNMTELANRVARVGLKRTFDKVDSSQLTMALAFERMKSNRLIAKLSSAITKVETLQPKYASASSQMHMLEQIAADWTEIVKGMNGACSTAIASGIQGLWAQSCSTLLSMMSSHLTITGCGLILHNFNSTSNNSELIEYCVRELSTPMAAPHTVRHFSNDDNDDPNVTRELADYARGMLENRPASDLGQKVYSLAQEIMAGHGGSQRIFKLTRPKTYPGGSKGIVEEGEHLWLVPVKTARSVLAVLRVSVEVPVDIISSPLSPIPKAAGDKHSLSILGDDGNNNKFSPEMLSQSAQGNMINFAEVMAPVFAVTMQLDRKKKQTELMDQSLRKQTHQLTEMAGDLSSVTRSVTQLQTAVGVLNKLFSNDWQIKETVKLSLTSICDHVSIALGEVLGCRIGIQVNGNASLTQLGFSYDSSDEASGESKKSHKSSGRVSVQQLLDGKGLSFGSVTFEGLRDDKREGIQTLTFENVDGSSDSLNMMTKAITSVLAGKLLSYASEVNGKLKMMDLKDTIVDYENNVNNYKTKVEDVTDSCSFYRGLADVINQCLVFTTMQQHPDAESPSHSAKLIELLRNLTHRLPVLIGSSSLFNFAVVDATAVTHETSHGQEEGLKVLNWVYGSGLEEGNTSTGFAATTAQYLKINDDVREMSTNLAHSCIQKKVKSSFDIGLNPSIENQINMSSMHLSTTGHLKLSAVRILTFPLLQAAYPHNALGAMQVMLDVSVEHGEVDSLCEDVAKAIAYAMSQAVHQQNLLAQLNGLELASLVLNSRITEETAVKEMWQQRCSAWRGAAVTTSLAVTGFGASNEKDFIDMLKSPVVAATLENCGLSLNMKSSTPNSVIQPSIALPGTIATALIPMTENGDTIAEISCHQQINGPVDGLTVIASELVETISDVIRAGVRFSRSRQVGFEEIEKRNASVNHKVDKLKHHLKLAKEELNETERKKSETSYDLMVQIERYEALRSHASTAVTSLCLPAISEMVAMLVDINGREQQTTEASGLEWAWDGLARVASRAVSRISNGCFSHHVSVLARCSPHDVDRPTDGSVLVRVFDGSQLEASKKVHSVKYTPSNASEGSVVEKCLRLGGIQENIGDAVQPIDLTGIHNHLLTSTFAKSKNSPADIAVLCVAMQNVHQEIVGVVRIVYREIPSDDIPKPVGAHTDILEKFSVSLLKPVMEMITVLGGALVQASTQQLHRVVEVKDVQQSREADAKKIAELQDSIVRTRQMFKVVCRESSMLLDAPVVSHIGSAPRAIHPANLTPLAASQDTCLKLLSIIRTLLRSEGQALLLKDPSSEPLTYQVIFTGDSLRWPGVEQSTFGVVSAPASTTSSIKSLAETAMNSRKSVYTGDAPNDSRYSSYLDGVCSLGTPLLAVPLKGRGGTVVGVLLVARPKGSTGFSTEDISAAEICTCLGSLSLYWCQGLGTLHHQLNKSVKKMDQLEKTVQRLRQGKESIYD